jgi:hypothetical protein
LVEILNDDYFLQCESFTSLTFESESKLSQIGKQGVANAVLIEVVVLASAEIFDEDSCLGC